MVAAPKAKPLEVVVAPNFTGALEVPKVNPTFEGAEALALLPNDGNAVAALLAAVVNDEADSEDLIPLNPLVGTNVAWDSFTVSVLGFNCNVELPEPDGSKENPDC